MTSFAPASRRRARLATVAAVTSMLGATVTGTAVSASAGAPAATPTATARTASAIACYTSSSGAAASFYAGPSASYRYDNRFSASRVVPHRDTHTPQGAATWRNWDGTGRDLLLVTAYRDGSRSYVIGIDPATGAHVQSASIAESHVGGIAVSRGWAFVTGKQAADGTHTIRKYRLSDLRLAMNYRRGHLSVSQVGTARRVYGASFLSASGSTLYAGRFNSGGRDRMYRYSVAADGTLTTLAGWTQVPMKTQGLVVTSGHFIYSTSHGRTNRSNVYVVRRGHRYLDDSSLSCFRAPSMAEGITAYGGRAYLVFESGSHLYRATALNPIGRLHKATLSSLTALVP